MKYFVAMEGRHDVALNPTLQNSYFSCWKLSNAFIVDRNIKKMLKPVAQVQQNTFDIVITKAIALQNHLHQCDQELFFFAESYDPSHISLYKLDFDSRITHMIDFSSQVLSTQQKKQPLNASIAKATTARNEDIYVATSGTGLLSIMSSTEPCFLTLKNVFSSFSSTQQSSKLHELVSISPFGSQPEQIRPFEIVKAFFFKDSTCLNTLIWSIRSKIGSEKHSVCEIFLVSLDLKSDSSISAPSLPHLRKLLETKSPPHAAFFDSLKSQLVLAADPTLNFLTPHFGNEIELRAQDERDDQSAMRISNNTKNNFPSASKADTATPMSYSHETLYSKFMAAGPETTIEIVKGGEDKKGEKCFEIVPSFNSTHHKSNNDNQSREMDVDIKEGNANRSRDVDSKLAISDNAAMINNNYGDNGDEDNGDVDPNLLRQSMERLRHHVTSESLDEGGALTTTASDDKNMTNSQDKGMGSHYHDHNPSLNALPAPPVILTDLYDEDGPSANDSDEPSDPQCVVYGFDLCRTGHDDSCRTEDVYGRCSPKWTVDCGPFRLLSTWDEGVHTAQTESCTSNKSVVEIESVPTCNRRMYLGVSYDVDAALLDVSGSGERIETSEEEVMDKELREKITSDDEMSGNTNRATVTSAVRHVGCASALSYIWAGKRFRKALFVFPPHVHVYSSSITPSPSPSLAMSPSPLALPLRCPLAAVIVELKDYIYLYRALPRERSPDSARQNEYGEQQILSLGLEDDEMVLGCRVLFTLDSKSTQTGSMAVASATAKVIIMVLTRKRVIRFDIVERMGGKD